MRLLASGTVDLPGARHGGAGPVDTDHQQPGTVAVDADPFIAEYGQTGLDRHPDQPFRIVQLVVIPQDQEDAK